MKYKALIKQSFTKGNYSIVPIRLEDRYEILKWRNEQIKHLRQTTPLKKEDQDKYFNTVVTKLFSQKHPSQILFSYLDETKCIGYGGLVHINWMDKNAEISFIMDTALEKENFSKHWSLFLDLIEQVGFKELKLYKIYTFAFDLRPHLYEPIENANYKKEATLKKHCFVNNEFKDVIIHSKINTF
jgi:RimJ/RimL family protein N-acetyltransferase